MEKIELEPLFYFINEQISLVKLKNRNSSSHELFLKINESQKLIKFKYINEDIEIIKENPINITTFENGELRFHGEFAKFIFDKKAYLIMNQNIQNIPIDLVKSIGNYFK